MFSVDWLQSASKAPPRPSRLTLERLEERLAPAVNATTLFAGHFGGNQNVIAGAVALDSLGNSHVTGRFTGTVDFDPGVGVSNLTSAGANDVFVVKLNPSGAFASAKQLGGAGSDASTGIAVDGFGNAFVTGDFLSTDFSTPDNPTTLNPFINSDAFVVKLDSSGSTVYAKRLGGSHYDSGTAIAATASGDAFVVGYFGGPDFGLGGGRTLAADSETDTFVVKLHAGTPSTLLAEALYSDLLYRTASAADIQFWANVADSQGFAAAVAGFVNSQEYRTRIIHDLYQKYLGRAEDAAGLQNWLGVFAQNGSSTDVERGIVLSAEYLQKSGGTIDALFAQLYLDALGRSIDGAGQALVSSGAPLNVLVDTVLHSLEYYTREIDDIYLTFLGRHADAGGSATWVGQFLQGAGPEGVLLSILANPFGEYFSRVTS